MTTFYNSVSARIKGCGEKVLELEHLLGNLKLLAAVTLTTLTLAHDKKKRKKSEHSDQRENSVACNLRR